MGKNAWLVSAALAVVSIIIVLARGLGQDFHRTVVANTAASRVYSNAIAAPLQAAAPTTPALNEQATDSRLNDDQLERDSCCVGERCTWAGQLVNPRAARIRTGAAPLYLNGFHC